MSPPLSWKCTDYLTIFLSIWIILSVWAAYAGVLSPLVVVLALILTYAILRLTKYAPHEGKIPLEVMGAGLLTILLMGFIFFGIQGGYDLSADAAPSIATTAIQSHIPSDYSPYFDLPYFYQLGLPTIASQFTNLGFHPHHVLWAFALVGLLLAMAGLTQLAKHLHLSAAVAVWVPILFLCARIPFSNLLLGEYPWLLAMGIGFMSVSLLQRSHFIGTIALAAAMITHPYIGVLCALAWVVLFFPQFKKIILTIFGVGVACIPVIQYQILGFIGLAKEPLSGTEPLALANFIASAHLQGLIPFALSLAWIAHKMISKKPFTRSDIALIGIGFGGLILSVLLNALFPELILGTKIPALVLIGMTLMGAQFLSAMVKPMHVGKIALALLAVALVLIVTSSSMHSTISGSKITLEEAQFATRLGAHDSAIVPVLFLSDSAGKMAQYSQKIPSDPRGAHFMLSLQLLRTPRALELKEQSNAQREMLATKCAACVDAFLQKYPQHYIVVNTEEFPALSARNEIFREGKLILYAVKP
ncbi:MAG: hypothetical protein IPJ89_02960 [Candidatus Iainarchaeum archaeon]|uniref:Glycosyltransferase family 39 protein n=1 Tax=Candidatus Iainarchaeum sp. TaxID=3101447 RepID=A0A7T9I0N6_9ARCH|nr:MAG: hypothetical protein IPJ89_02960 [Candidatus Diapherotrites archaeon]